MKLFQLFAGVCLLTTQGQLISMTICSDDICSKDCVSWTATSGKCSPCQSNLGPCSATNPSSIVTTSYITLYSDSTCQKAISGTENIGLLMDSGCNVLVAAYSSHIGSYKASNTSAIIGSAIAGSILLLSLCVCGFCLRRGFRDTQKPDKLNDKNVIPSGYIAPLVPYPTNVSYTPPQIIQPSQYYPQQGQMQFYPTYIPHMAQPYYVQQQAPPPSAPPAYRHDNDTTAECRS